MTSNAREFDVMDMRAAEAIARASGCAVEEALGYIADGETPCH
ncbi:hypothetical protein [Nonomuraea roseoviolacea]|uniref:Uncharacterized protein n=1 Tax=Nonomuraea roseoviolacea subsp. carminata TaxID=160689 RepID=A0ABT1K985_9ACTN|nr:hypothetical protein [Nonomuraea roseoviolacea]MCP2350594.1 hypothetical protein [Nonomuraea roseoviolacea subsp. carminata]